MPRPKGVVMPSESTGPAPDPIQRRRYARFLLSFPAESFRLFDRLPAHTVAVRPFRREAGFPAYLLFAAALVRPSRPALFAFEIGKTRSVSNEKCPRLGTSYPVVRKAAFSCIAAGQRPALPLAGTAASALFPALCPARRACVSRKKRGVPFTLGRAALCRRLAFCFFKGKVLSHKFYK